MKFRTFALVVAIAVLLAPGRPDAVQEEFPFELFGRYIEPLVPHIGMPGLSAAILQKKPEGSAGAPKVVRYYNFGHADVERKIPARSDTPYPIGGMTQAVTGVLSGICIDRFRYDIDDDIRLVVPSFPHPDTQVRQVLSHSTGGRFRYDPALYSYLTQVIESRRCFNQPFRTTMATEVLDFMSMTRSVPGLDIGRAEGGEARALFDARTIERYQRVLADTAVPYRLDLKGRSFRSEYPSYGLDAASGLVSTIDDLILFESQLDKRDNHPLSVTTLDRMWGNQIFTVNNVQIAMPTGLGWFVTTESGQPLVWTFGMIPDAGSALIVKLPRKNLTLIMLANSPGLAQGYDLQNGQVTASPFVKIFLRLFI